MERNGYAAAASYVDRAKSGATVHERTDFQRMLADARKALFRAVCAETTGRYGRDEEDRAGSAELSDDAAALAFACEIVRELMPRGIASTHPSSLVKVRDQTRPTVFSIPFLPACA